MIEQTGEVVIESRDYWYNVVGMLQQYWALVDDQGLKTIVWFIDDGSTVINRKAFYNKDVAFGALRSTGFRRYAEDVKAKEGITRIIRPPEPPFWRDAH